jgi:type IV pilus assembly protein PilW
VLAENIESLSLRFAVTDPAVAGSKNAVGYLTATQINTPVASLAGLTPVERWTRVVAARICVVVTSENAVLQDMKSDSGINPTYEDCNGANVDITDGKMRRAYRTTVILRNHGVGYVDA